MPSIKFSGVFLKKIVLGAMHEVFVNKELPLTVRLGIIALIPKGDKDRRILGNEQKAYVPGGFISECTRNTYDIFTHAK